MRTIEKLTYINERGEAIEFSHASIYHTNKVSGLSDIRNALYSINSMGQDGDTFLGSRIESREIEITGSIATRNRDETLTTRRRLNHVLNPHIGAKLVYEYGDFLRVIDCRVDNAPVYSRKAIFQDFTVQLICHNPFWREDAESKADVASWVGGFEFELEIPIDEGMEFGYREPSIIVNVFNSGDVASGIRIEFRAIGTVTNPSLLNVNTGEFIKVNYTLYAGDALVVSTYYGEKEVTLKSGGFVTDAFRYLDADSTYLQLDVGDNLFRYDAEANVDALELSIYHNNQYLGV
jgi:hypothetical protein